MKTSISTFQLKALKMYIPELEKGERNPYIKDLTLDIKKEDIKDVLTLLENKGYDIAEFMHKKPNDKKYLMHEITSVINALQELQEEQGENAKVDCYVVEYHLKDFLKRIKKLEIK